MLVRKHRVPKNLFPLLKKNTLYEGEVFDLRVTKIKKDLTVIDSKCVCIISKKIEKKACNRNLMKRRVYSILNVYLDSMQDNCVIQIFPKKSAFTKKYVVLDEILSKQIEPLINQK